MQKLLPCLALIAFGCATRPADTPAAAPAVSHAANAAPAPAPAPQREISAADLVDHAGDSPETAVRVPPDSPNEGVDFQNRWIFQHFGRFRRQKFAMGHAPAEVKRCATDVLDETSA